MKVIGVCGRKGGSGKTTTAIHLAAELSTRGRSVVLIDCDTQGSATYWADPGRLPMTVKHMPLETDAEVGTWSAQVKAIKADILVLDAPPHLNAGLGGIIGLSDIAVVPCGPSGLDLAATAEAVGVIREIRGHRGGTLPHILLVPNRVDHRTASGKELTTALAAMGEPVSTEIRYRTAFSDAFNDGSWVGTYAPNSLAHKEMTALADQVIKMMGEP
jgi:chromosome partitioning protein